MPNWATAVLSTIDRPYKILFLIYVIVTFVGGAIAFALRIPQGYIYLVVAVGASALALIAFFLWFPQSLMRSYRNAKARKLSESPHMKILYEDVTLDYREPELVEYERKVTVQPCSHSQNSMVLFIDWRGNEKDFEIGSTVGCNISLRKVKEGSGYFIDITFSREIPVKSPYTFGFSIIFDNKSGLIRPFIQKIYSYIPERRLRQTLILPNNTINRFAHTTLISHNSNKPLREVFEDGLSSSTFTVENTDQRRGYRLALSN